jgi:hypothetical protein
VVIAVVLPLLCRTLAELPTDSLHSYMAVFSAFASHVEAVFAVLLCRTLAALPTNSLHSYMAVFSAFA